VRCCDVGRCGMVVLIRVLLVVCKIMGKEWDGTLVFKRRFESDGSIVFNELLFGVGGFPFLLTFLILLYSKVMDDFGNNLDPLVLFLNINSKFKFELDYISVNDIAYIRSCPLH